MGVMAMQVLCECTDMAHTRSQVVRGSPGASGFLVDLTGYQVGLALLLPPSFMLTPPFFKACCSLDFKRITWPS